MLNARNDEAEAEIIAQAGALGAVTVSTNMAGRGTDILLGGNPPKDREKVVELGGLYVMGTTRHEARRIDNQLRGRAGRQGDPGTSRFFISLDDDLLVRFGIAENPDIDSVQRTAEGQNLQMRETLWKYDCVVENHRREVYDLRREILLSADWTSPFDAARGAMGASSSGWRRRPLLAEGKALEERGARIDPGHPRRSVGRLPCKCRGIEGRHPLGFVGRARSAL